MKVAAVSWKDQPRRSYSLDFVLDGAAARVNPNSLINCLHLSQLLLLLPFLYVPWDKKTVRISFFKVFFSKKTCEKDGACGWRLPNITVGFLDLG